MYRIFLWEGLFFVFRFFVVFFFGGGLNYVPVK